MCQSVLFHLLIHILSLQKNTCDCKKCDLFCCKMGRCRKWQVLVYGEFWMEINTFSILHPPFIPSSWNLLNCWHTDQLSLLNIWCRPWLWSSGHHNVHLWCRTTCHWYNQHCRTDHLFHRWIQHGLGSQQCYLWTSDLHSITWNRQWWTSQSWGSWV